MGFHFRDYGISFISPQGAKNLPRYKYKGEDRSVISKYILQPVWNFALQYVPLWMAPNLVTLVGFLAVCLSYAITVQYEPELEGFGPRWIYIFNGLALFFYMMMDNLDGKQARRTKSSSPLGQLFDHGCDALNSTVSGLTLCACLQTGPGWLMYAFMFQAYIPFFFATWEEYHTGCLLLREINGPTEGLLLIIGMHLYTGIAGPQVWTQDIRALVELPSHMFGHPVPAIKMNMMPACLGTLSVIITVFFTIVDVVAAVRAKKGDLVGAFAQHLPMVAIVTMSAEWLRMSPDLVARHPHQFCFLFGLLLGTMVNRMILAHLCDQHFRTFNKILLPLPLAVINAHIGRPINEDTVLLGYLVLVAASFVIYVIGVIDDITTILRIKCFQIPYPPPDVSPLVRLVEELDQKDAAAAATTNGNSSAHAPSGSSSTLLRRQMSGKG